MAVWGRESSAQIGDVESLYDSNNYMVTPGVYRGYIYTEWELTNL